MNCASCQNWRTIGTTGSERGDAQMKALDFANCLADKSEFSYARFVHADSHCEKHEAKKV